MRTTIDRAGRVVVPKSLRDAFGLTGGTEVEIRGRGGHLELEPVPTPMRLVRRGKGLVATTDEPLPALDAEQVRDALEAARR